MYGYQQTAYNYGAYPSANGQQQTAAGYFGYGQQQGSNSSAATATGTAALTAAANAYANTQFSLAASAYAQYSQAAQQQQGGSSAAVTGGYGHYQPPPPPPPPPPPCDYSGTPSGAYGVIGGGKPKASPATGSNAVSSHYAGYEAAVYAAANNYIQGKGTAGGGGGWQQQKNSPNRGYQKKRYGLGHQNRNLEQFFCETCKISCAGENAYNDHLRGKTHKKREQLNKESGSRGVGFRCEVCELTCSSRDTYDSHVKGQKHQRTVALLRRMGKPVPQQDIGDQSNAVQGQPIPTVGSSGPLKKVVGVTGTKFVGGTTLLTTGEELKTGASPAPSITGAVRPQDLEKALLGDEDVKPVGQEFIEEQKDAHGKFLSYQCKLCDCNISDIGAKNVHLKGRRHRLQYKQKVDPNLKVELKGNWAKNNGMVGSNTYQNIGAHMPPPAAFQMTQQPRSHYPMPRSQEIMDDKHVMKKLQEIQLDANEMRNIERLALLVEKTLKEVSDALIKSVPVGEQAEQQRTLKGVMRVGELAKQLLIKTDKQIELVVLCSKIPTVTLLKEVAELFKKHADVQSPDELTVVDKVEDSAIYVTLSGIDATAKVTLTCVLLREGNNQQQTAAADGAAADTPTDPLPNGPCLNALAELRHAKFYQVKCAPLHSMNSTVKIIRDISQRVRTWSLMSSWVIELLVEKTLASVAMPLSPGDAVRRFFEVISSGFILSKRAKLLDPCEKEQVNALAHIGDQEREDITSSAQHALRLIAYNQIYKILGIDRLPDPLPLGAQQPREGAKTGMKRRADGSAAHGGQLGMEGQDPPPAISVDLGLLAPQTAQHDPSAAADQRGIPADDAPEAKKGKIESNAGKPDTKEEVKEN